MSELEAVVSEEACWRQIKMTCDTENKSLEEAFTFFYMEIQPKIQPYADLLNRKLVECSFTRELDHNQYFTISALRKNGSSCSGRKYSAAGRAECTGPAVWGHLRQDDGDDGW